MLLLHIQKSLLVSILLLLYNNLMSEYSDMLIIGQLSDGTIVHVHTCRC